MHQEDQVIVFPMSFAQQRLWILDQFEGGATATYNIARAYTLTGPLDVDALTRSFTEILRRHEALRTTFDVVEGEPVQVIAPPVPFSLERVDLRSLHQGERGLRLEALIQVEAHRAFDLRVGPLIRATVYQAETDEHVLLLGMHHIVSDGWSMEVLQRELWTLYEAFSVGTPSPLPTLSIQYADYGEWQRRWLHEGTLTQQLAYWKDQLRGLAPLALPTDRPRPKQQTYRGATHTFVLDKALTQRLKTVGLDEGATLFMVLLAAWNVLLHRYTAQTDLAVGTPIAGRVRRELEDLIGFFVNTLVMRTDLSSDPTFREVLARVRTVSLEAYDHQNVPFEHVVEALEPERDQSRSPLFQVFFALQNAPKTSFQPGTVRIRRRRTDLQTAKFDLSLYLTENEEALHGVVEYNTDLFETATIERLAGHFQRLLEGLLDHPETPISALPLLSRTERRRLLHHWNDTHAPLPNQQGLHILFEQQADRTPYATALRFQDQTLSYRQLNQRANQLAHYLRRRGAGPERVVGVALDRSTEMVVAILGVLKAGAAYLPLDPAYPAERLRFMLEDTAAPLLVTQASLRDRLPRAGAETLYLDTDGHEIAREPTDNPAPGTTAAHLAYVIYTSGSTGRPKGVEGTHRATINRLAWMWKHYPFAADEVAVQKTALSFIDSVWELFGPLLQGLPLVLVPDAVVKDPPALLGALGAARVTRLVLVPSLLRALLDRSTDLAEAVPHLRYWISSGERLSVDLWQRFHASRAPGQLLNLYGSSEVAGDVTSYAGPGALSHGCVPIGRPITNTQVYVLDASFNVLPVGVPGALYVGGQALARGYHRRAALTAERFVPDPFSAVPGARLYQTGDRVRWLADGSLAYLGRIDGQVKLRGYRIELGEIEAVLAQHEAVAQAIAVVREASLGDKRLVAYVVAASSQQPSVDAWRAHLREQLPAYMVPSSIVLLEALPLTPNGKVDRKALPAPEAGRREVKTDYVAPGTPLEIGIAEIWQEVLALEHVGLHDNFIDLGGHSLLATQVTARLESTLGLRINPIDLLFQTLGQFVASCAEQLNDAGYPEAFHRNGSTHTTKATPTLAADAVLRVKEAVQRWRKALE